MTRRVRVGCAGLLLMIGAASACRFERRTDLAADEPLLAAGGYLPTDRPTTPLEDSVRAAVVALTDALGAADSARVVARTTPDVMLIDQEEEIRWNRAGGILPRSLLHDPSVPWRVTGISFGPIGGGAIYSVLLEADAPDGEPWDATESWVVVRTEAGWRVRYLHRSRGSSAPLP